MTMTMTVTPRGSRPALLPGTGSAGGYGLSSRPQWFCNSASPPLRRAKTETGRRRFGVRRSRRWGRRSRRRKDGKATHTKPQPRTLLPSPCCWGERHGDTPGTSRDPRTRLGDQDGHGDGRSAGCAGMLRDGTAAAARPAKRTRDPLHCLGTSRTPLSGDTAYPWCLGTLCIPRCLGTPRTPFWGGLERRWWHLVRGHLALPVPSSVEPLRALNPESWGAAVVEFDQYMLVFHVIDMII